MKLAIIKYCKIKNYDFSLNGENLFQNSNVETSQEFLTSLYREMKVAYPKYFKMDNLSKTGFLAAELLLRDTPIYSQEQNLNTGIFLSNSYSSLETDTAFQNTIGEEFFPSPSLFVYTLPNIVMGEIAIKHKIFGENTFFVSQTFDIESTFDYVSQTFSETNLEFAIVGWVEFYKKECEAFVMLVSNQKIDSGLEIEFSIESIKKIYN